jgi:hypothetical protein
MNLNLNLTKLESVCLVLLCEVFFNLKYIKIFFFIFNISTLKLYKIFKKYILIFFL